MGYSCIVCSRGVSKNSKALECEECKEWCHIRCGIEITLAQYELVTQGKLEYEWTCHLCSEPAPKRQRTRSPTPPRLLNVTFTIDQASLLSSPTQPTSPSTSVTPPASPQPLQKATGEDI